MVNPNFLVIAFAALVPIVLGFIWYHPKVLGNVWQQSARLSDQQITNANMPLIFGISLLLSFLLSIQINFIVIHQAHIYSVVIDEPSLKDPNSALSLMLKNFMEQYGSNFRTFKHGAFHGLLAGLFFVLPVLGTNALLERKGFKYIAINVGYWIVALTIMGGIICRFG
jgi:hypothetical protein